MAPPIYVSPLRRKAARRRNLVAGLVAGLGLAVMLACVFWPVPPAPPPPVTATPPAPVRVARPPAPPLPPAPAPSPDLLIRATLIAPDSVLVGSTVNVRWTGPENPEDFVTLVKPDAPENEYGESHATSTGRILQFTVPEEPGPLEWRYVAGRAKVILGRAPMSALPLTARVSAPDEAIMGARITVNWSGPNRPGDFLTVVPRNAAENQVEGETPLAGGSPVSLAAPEDPGEAEIRYLTKDHKVLGRCPITIVIPVTTLFAPTTVKAGSPFEVRWHGPDNPSDSITLVPRGTPDGKLGPSVPTAKGSPLTLVAPSTSGRMELRYMTGSKSLVLSRSPIEIQP